MSKIQEFFEDPSENAQIGKEQHLPMKVNVKISSIRPEGNIRAIASLNLNDCFAIRNVKVVEGTKGFFIAMPSYKSCNGEYRDTCFPLTKKFREQLYKAVIDAYHQALIQSLGQSQKTETDSFEQIAEQHPGMQIVEQ